MNPTTTSTVWGIRTSSLRAGCLVFFFTLVFGNPGFDLFDPHLHADDVPFAVAEQTVDAEPQPPRETPAAATPASSPQARVAPSVQVSEQVPAPTLVDRIDGVFAGAVGMMEQVLFYRLGKSSREYIQFNWTSVYVRPAGSSAAFQNVSPAVAGEEESLDADEVEVLAAQGKLLPGHVVGGEQQYYRIGTLAGENVEYVTVKRDAPNGLARYGQRFAYQASSNDFREIVPPRNLPGELVLSASQVDEWHQLGFLRTAPEETTSDRPYLLSESVGGVPFVVGWLALGAVFFTLFMRGFNIWGFRHALDIIRGKFDDPNAAGEVSHFQALSSALSATIGLGNIAGVTIAMTVGGPGAFFWMLVCGVFGMSTKFTECTLGQKYRAVRPDGSILGGPMRYLRIGLAEIKLGALGIVLSFLFTVMCILASFGGGNMLQANQAGSAMLQMFQQNRLDEVSAIEAKIRTAAEREDVAEMQKLQQDKTALQGKLATFEGRFKVLYGVILAALVGTVIIGGIKRIGATAAKIVPTMSIMYCLACIYIITLHIQQVPGLIVTIFQEAFSGAAMGGGVIGVLVVGVQRAAFSNEAGAGSAAIAHSAARTDEPIREGCVALLEPFIDTIVVCSMTALVILITGAWNHPEWVTEQGLQGAALTSRAFKEEISWFPILLSVAVTLFAYSTIISWSYYGEKSWETLFGSRSTVIYKVLAVIAVFVGSVVNLGSVLDFSDMMILGMAFPNIMGVVLLAPLVRKDLMNYWGRYQSGEFQTYK